MRILIERQGDGIECVENSHRSIEAMAYRLSQINPERELRMSIEDPQWSHGSLESQLRMWDQSIRVPSRYLGNSSVLSDAEDWLQSVGYRNSLTQA